MSERDISATPSELPGDRLQRLEEMGLATALSLTHSLPYVAALAVIVPALTALLLERDDLRRFVEDVSATADETTRVAIAQLLSIDAAVH